MIAEGIIASLIFALTAAIPVCVLGILMMRQLRKSFEAHRDALYREACRAFSNERLKHWQQIARAKAGKMESNAL